MPGRSFERYAAAVILAVVAAAVVVWQLARSDSTACVRSSIELSATGVGRIEGCDEHAAKSVREHLAQREPGAAAEEPSELDAKSALVVWIALFAATAGAAAASAVRSVATVADFKPAWTRDLVGLSLVAAILVVLPFAVFRLLAARTSERLGPFDDLHLDELAFLNPMIALLTLPAVIGLVAVGYVIATQGTFNLVELASHGSRIRAFVGMLGTVLALGVLTTAARWQVIATLPGGESVPSTIVLLWGAVFALVIAVLYLPVHELWVRKTKREITEEVKRQLSGNDNADGTAGFRPPELALKRELESTLGVGRALRSLQGSVAVLAPVIAAAVSSLFS
jgi:hypothetical protein